MTHRTKDWFLAALLIVCAAFVLTTLVPDAAKAQPEPYSTDTYTGNGTTSAYAVTFPYLSQNDVSVTIAGVSTTAFTWTSSSTITFNTPPTSGAAIVISRHTSPTSPERTFAGGPMASSDLNANALQAVYLAQENADVANLALSTAVGGGINIPSLSPASGVASTSLVPCSIGGSVTATGCTTGQIYQAATQVRTLQSFADALGITIGQGSLTNDTAAFDAANSAIIAAASSGGLVVTVAPGSYQVQGSVTGALVGANNGGYQCEIPYTCVLNDNLAATYPSKTWIFTTHTLYDTGVHFDGFTLDGHWGYGRSPYGGTTQNVSSVAYNSGTGVVTITFASSAIQHSGDPISVRGLTGTGSYQAANVSTTAGAVSGDTVQYTIQSGLTLTFNAGAGTVTDNATPETDPALDKQGAVFLDEQFNGVSDGTYVANSTLGWANPANHIDHLRIGSFGGVAYKSQGSGDNIHENIRVQGVGGHCAEVDEYDSQFDHFDLGNCGRSGLYSNSGQLAENRINIKAWYTGYRNITGDAVGIYIAGGGANEIRATLQDMWCDGVYDAAADGDRWNLDVSWEGTNGPASCQNASAFHSHGATAHEHVIMHVGLANALPNATRIIYDDTSSGTHLLHNTLDITESGMPGDQYGVMQQSWFVGPVNGGIDDSNRWCVNLFCNGTSLQPSSAYGNVSWAIPDASGGYCGLVLYSPAYTTNLVSCSGGGALFGNNGGTVSPNALTWDKLGNIQVRVGGPSGNLWSPANCAGDSGSGGTQGLVPAPPSGSFAAGKFLSAGCTWVAPPNTCQTISVTIGTNATLSHSLGVVPGRATLKLTNNGTSNLGYGSGDEVLIPAGSVPGSNQGLQVWAPGGSTSSLDLVWGSSGISLLNASTGSGSAISPADWTASLEICP
jgi:hypothetical protein